MNGRATLVRDADLAPSVDLKRATEPGFLRSLTTWVGGPEGCVNSNPGASVRSERCAVGLMRMPVGNRQPGVHIHSVAEIYVILRGEVESFDGQNRLHRAGPLDCLYIPAGVPHGVRAVGSDDLELIWLHDGVEGLGVSTYLEGEGPYPSHDEVRLVTFDALLAHGSEGGGVRRMSWVGSPEGGVNHSRAIAAQSTRIAVGLTVVPPGASGPSHRHPHAEIYVVLTGEGSVACDGGPLDAGRLDAVHVPPGAVHALGNPGRDPLYVLWAHEGR